MLVGDTAAPKKGTEPPMFSPCLLWPNSWLDQDATWYRGRPRPGPRPHCVRWGPSSPPPERGTTVRLPVSVVAKRSPIFRAALRLVRVWVLCQMLAPYRPITTQKFSTAINCGPHCVRWRLSSPSPRNWHRSGTAPSTKTAGPESRMLIVLRHD